MAATVAFLTTDWLAEVQRAFGALPVSVGASGVVQSTVTGGPAGDVTYWLVVDDGRVVDAGLGQRPDATVTLTSPYPVAVEVAGGRVPPAVPFMQGRTKVAGDQAALLRWLALTATPAYREAAARLAARTRPEADAAAGAGGGADPGTSS